MRRSQTSLGTIGVAALFFGGVAYAITQDVGFFVVVNVLFGIFALIAYVASARDSLGTFLGERSTKFGANAALYSVLFIGILLMVNFLAPAKTAAPRPAPLPAPKPAPSNPVP